MRRPARDHRASDQNLSLVEFVRARGNDVSFAEITEVKKWQGDLDFLLPNPASGAYFVVWVRLSQMFFDEWKQARDAHELHIYPTTALTYFCDGHVLALRVARRVCKTKKSEWVPMVLRLGPFPEGPSWTKPSQGKKSP